MSAVKHRFAKLFEVGEHQLLVFIDETDDNEDEHTAIHQMAKVSAGLLDLTLRGPDEPMRKIFEEYGEEQAQNFFNISTVRSLMTVASEEPTP